MSPMDSILLASLLAAAVWRLAFPARWPPIRAIACLAITGLALAQFLLLGFTWQFVSGYVLLFVLALPCRVEHAWGRRITGAALSMLWVLTIAPWAILPAPDLPPPRGSHPVGSAIYRWVDLRRPELATPNAADHRNVVVQAWYPAAPSRGEKIDYFDGLGQLPPKVYDLPRFIFRRFGLADTHAIANAPASPDRAAWPVIIFSPGYGAPRAAYAGLLADLASRGYVVLALDHPYESAVVELADGRVVGPAPLQARDEREGVPHMDHQVTVRMADMRFVLDQLTSGKDLKPLSGRLDLSRIAAIGHSFGGATAVLTASHDSRIVAAADIDGMLYGDVRGENLRGPLLLMESARTHRIQPYAQATSAVATAARAGGWRYAIEGSNHLSFTDAERFLSAPARWVAARALGGERGAADTQSTAVDLLDAFLSPPLKGEPRDLAAAAAQARDVRGGRER